MTEATPYISNVRQAAAEADSTKSNSVPCDCDGKARKREESALTFPALPLPHNCTVTCFPQTREPPATRPATVSPFCRGAWTWATSETARATVAVETEASPVHHRTSPHCLPKTPPPVAALTTLIQGPLLTGTVTLLSTLDTNHLHLVPAQTAITGIIHDHSAPQDSSNQDCRVKDLPPPDSPFPHSLVWTELSALRSCQLTSGGCFCIAAEHESHQHGWHEHKWREWCTAGDAGDAADEQWHERRNASA